MKYRVTACRHDVPERQVGTIEADTDAVAMNQFALKFVANPNYGYDNLSLVRIDVEEKTTHIISGEEVKKGFEQSV